jgi:hypothetical protein
MPDQDNSAPRVRIPLETVLFWALLILHLVPVWALPFMPTQDGPGHQAVASVLRHYGDPDAGLLREYYELNREAVPNWLVFFLLGPGLRFLPVAVAEKVLLSLYILLLPLSVRFALRSVDRRAAWLSLLIFPFLFNFMFNMGFFNFCFSLPAFFFAVGFYLRRPEEMGLARTGGLALLVLLVYFCHPVTLVVTVAVLFTLAGWRALLDRHAGLWPAARRWLLAPVLACLPALILMASFVGARTGARVAAMTLWAKAKHLAGLYSLASLTRWTIPLAALVALLFGVLTLVCLRLRGRRPLQASDGLLAAAAVLLATYFAAPNDLSGGGFITHRLNLFPFLLLLLWFGTFQLPEKWKRGFLTAAAVLAFAFLAAFAPIYAALDEGLEEIAAAGDLIEPGHTFLFLSYAHWGEGPDGKPLAFRTEPFVHAGSYVAARRRLVDLSLYEANEDYFPIYYRPHRNPYRHLATVPLGIETVPPRVDLPGYKSGRHGRVDYVMIWGLRDPGGQDTAEILRQLKTDYDLVRASPDGRVKLFRVRADSERRAATR